MLVRTGNLIFASCAFVLDLMVLCGVRHAGPPPISHYLDNARGIIVDLIVLCWFAGAVGLFFRKRLAWVCSLIGVGASVCLFGAISVTGIGLFFFPHFFPNAEMEKLRNMGGYPGGYTFAIVFVTTWFLFLLASSIGLFIGLLRKRKNLLGA